MTSRKLLLLDRVATFLLALVLLALAGMAIWWFTGTSPLPERTKTAALQEVVDQQWWPWAAAAAGVVLILLGLRWLLAHLSSPRVSRLTLRGSHPGGKLAIDASRAASAAAQAFAATPGVRSAKGQIVKDRGRMVATVSAVIEPEADLPLLAAGADQVSADLAEVLGRDDLRCSVQLRVATRGRSLARVD